MLKKQPVTHSFQKNGNRSSGITSPYLFFILLSLIFCCQTRAQDREIEHIEATYDNLEGEELLDALVVLGEHYFQKEERKGMRYARQAVKVGTELDATDKSDSTSTKPRRRNLARAYLVLGNFHYAREDYDKASIEFSAALSWALLANDDSLMADSETRVAETDSVILLKGNDGTFLSRTLDNIGIKDAFNETRDGIVIKAETELGRQKEKAGNLPRAIPHYQKAIELMEANGDTVGSNSLRLKVAIILDSLDEHVRAQRILSANTVQQPSATDPAEADKRRKALVVDNDDGNSKAIANSLRQQRMKAKELAAGYAAKKDYENSLAYERLYHQLSLKIGKDSLTNSMENWRRDNEMLLLRQQKDIADLNIERIDTEKKREVTFRNIVLSVALLVLLATGVIYTLYLGKRRQHGKLTVAYKELEVAKAGLLAAETKIKGLLSQQVSDDIASELIGDHGDKPGHERFACIMFLDIRGFTNMVRDMGAEELIGFQNAAFGFMIDAVERHGGNVNQLLGDGFMATFGVPRSNGNDCLNAFMACRQILTELNRRILREEMRDITVGIGLHAGNVVAGNVGNEKRKQYSITGTPVIIASRVEQLNKEFGSQLLVTEDIYRRLDTELKPIEFHPEVSLKGLKEPIGIYRFA